MSIESMEREHKFRSRQDYLNRTWRNPRYYVVFPLLPIALAMIALPALIGGIAKSSEWLFEHMDSRLRTFWHPLNIWIEKGAKQTDDTE